MVQLDAKQAAERNRIISEDANWVRYAWDQTTGQSGESPAKVPSFPGGICRFMDMTPATLRKLVDLGYADRDDGQNTAPSLEEFLDWLDANPGFTAHGYAVTHERDDCRITIEGVCLKGTSTADQRAAFWELIKKTSEDGRITIDGEIKERSDYLHVWWD